MAQREHGVDIYCPLPAVPFINTYIETCISVNACAPFDVKYMQLPPEVAKKRSAGVDGRRWKLNGVVAGDTFTLPSNPSYFVEVFECLHAVPCVGYAIYNIRKKLKKEYVGLPPKELGVLRKEGKELSEEIKTPIFCYVGDTSIKVFEKNPKILQFPVVIVECTFLYDEKGIQERCERDGHIVWSQLEKIVVENKNVTFVLIHFSCRYTEDEVNKFFINLTTRTENPLDLKNVVVFVGDIHEGKPDK